MTTRSSGRQPCCVEWEACSSIGQQVLVSALKNPYTGALFNVQVLDPTTRAVVPGEDITTIRCCGCPVEEQQVCQFYSQSFMGNNSLSIAASKLQDTAIYDAVAGIVGCPVGAPRAVTFLVSLYVDGCGQVFDEREVGPIAVSPTGVADFTTAFDDLMLLDGFSIEWGDTFSASGTLGFKLTNPSDRDWWIIIRDRFDDHAGGLCIPTNDDFWVLRRIGGLVEDVIGVGATPTDPFTYAGGAVRPVQSCV